MYGAERALERAGRDRDERPDERREAAEEHRGAAVAVEPALGAVERLGRDVQPPPVAVEERPSAAAADRPADERAGEVAERPGEREDDVALGPGRHDVAEDDRLRAGDRARGERAGEEHHQLAADRQEGVDRHDREDRIGAVVPIQVVSCEVSDPRTNRWLVVAFMPSPRSGVGRAG